MAMRPPRGLPSVVGCCHVPVARLDDAVGDHVHRLLERELLPFGGVGAPVLPVLAQRAVDQALRRRSLGAQPAAGDRARRIAFDLGHLAVLDVDVLRRSRRRSTGRPRDDAVGAVDARVEGLRPGRLRGLAEAQRIPLRQLADERPRRQRVAHAQLVLEPVAENIRTGAERRPGFPPPRRGHSSRKPIGQEGVEMR